MDPMFLPNDLKMFDYWAKVLLLFKVHFVPKKLDDRSVRLSFLFAIIIFTAFYFDTKKIFYK